MSDSCISRPQSGEYPPPFENYIRLVPDGSILSILETQLRDTRQLLDNLPDQDSLAHHAPYTWSIRQVVGHITDCERVFGYRTLRISRNDSTPLAGFDETAWMQNVDFDRWPLPELLNEFEMVRRSHLALLSHLDPAAWIRRGGAINHPATARAFAYAMAGHARHHLDIVRKRLGR